MSFSLEFYSLNWEDLRKALSSPDPQLLQAVKTQQWNRILAEDDLGEQPHFIGSHLDDDNDRRREDVDGVFRNALAEIADVMSRATAPDHIPPDISDDAALVVAAFIAQLGKPMGVVRHDVVDQEESQLRFNFREVFLDGYVGVCFKEPRLGEYLAARPLFGLYHLSFVSWGGLSQKEMNDLLATYSPVEATGDWDEIAGFAKDWISALVKALQHTAASGSELVTILCVDQEHYSGYRGEVSVGLGDALPGKIGQWLAGWLRPKPPTSG